ncbi:MAG: 3-dehydroquinate synthase [Muribaculaceae bacterium]|nr:3-dehydroquinate synthase [Muribaculaceae bacterium]
MKKKLLFTNHVAQAVDEIAGRLEPSSVFVLVDANTKSFVLPRMMEESETVRGAKVITVRAGEVYKTLPTLSAVWKELGDAGANRRSLLVNLGGGIVSDTGGFAAATFKRGIPFLNVPTTLLAAVDASVGAKTGINFNDLKNEVGVFAEPEMVIVSTTFFRTLDSAELLNGYAEMLKHALLTDLVMTDRLLAYDVTRYEPEELLRLVEESVEVKTKYVAADPSDLGARHALNLGHTFAHAFEELSMRRESPVAHGYAVAQGLVAALVLSHMELGFPSEELHKVAAFVRERYGALSFTCDDYPSLLGYMERDKKNTTQGEVNFTLLRAPGRPEVNVPVSRPNIEAALDIYRDLLGV